MKGTQYLTKTLLLILLIIATATTTLGSIQIGTGVIFEPTQSNNTYNTTSAFTASEVNVTATGLYVNGSLASQIQNVDINLTSLSEGNQTYSVSFNATNGVYELSSCYMDTQAGDKSLTHNLSLNLCSGNIELNQNSSNTFYPIIQDAHFKINTSKERGVEVSEPNAEYYQDTSRYSDLSSQKFLREYNITNNLDSNFTNISFSPNSSEPDRTINLTNGTTEKHNGSFSADFIEEDSSYTIAGDSFLVNTGYNIYKTFIENNTESVELPEIMMAIELDYYDSNTLAESQNGLLWPDLNSSYNNSHILFNLSSLNSSDTQQYRYSYDAIIADWSGESIANYVLSGEYRLWSLDRTYYFNFPLTNKTITEDISLGVLTEWQGKTSTWGSTLLNNVTGSSVTHTTSDGVTYASISIPSINSTAGYDYTLNYYTLGSVTSSGGGGGGGGGGGSISIDEDELNETITKLVTDKTTKKGVIQFYYPGHERLISYLPTQDFYKEVVIKAVGGNVQDARIVFSDNLQSYFEGAICDMRTSDCYQEISLKEGEEKYIFIMGNLSDENFAEELMTMQKVDGYIQVYSNSQPISNPYNLTMKKAQLFDFTYNLTNKIDSENINQKSVFYLTVICLMVVIAISGFYVLRAFRVI